MTITIGQALPSGTLYESTGFDAENGCPLPPKAVEISTLTADKKVIIFAVPGAFTPLCSAQHLPGYIAHAKALKAAGVDEIICLAVNDAFVMAAWGQQQQAQPHIRMLADGSGHYMKALGLQRDLSNNGMGIRSYRFAMIVTNGIVEYFGKEGSGEFGVSKADTLLATLTA